MHPAPSTLPKIDSCQLAVPPAAQWPMVKQAVIGKRVLNAEIEKEINANFGITWSKMHEVIVNYKHKYL